MKNEICQKNKKSNQKICLQQACQSGKSYLIFCVLYIAHSNGILCLYLILSFYIYEYCTVYTFILKQHYRTNQRSIASPILASLCDLIFPLPRTQNKERKIPLFSQCSVQASGIYGRMCYLLRCTKPHTHT